MYVVASVHVKASGVLVVLGALVMASALKVFCVHVVSVVYMVSSFM